MIEVLVATANQGKAREMHQIVDDPEVVLLSAVQKGTLPDVVEDGDSFRENAVKKACACADANGMPAVADDSGLEVDALGGAPGIHSARYAGEGASDEDKVKKLLNALSASMENRTARFVCVIAVASPTGLVGTANGYLCGEIVHKPRGDNGFGYDPVFVPMDYNRTLAELDAEEKNRISHRAEALRAACRDGLFTGI